MTIEAGKFKIGKLFDMSVKLDKIKDRVEPSQWPLVQQVEMQKVFDAIHLKFGFDDGHLARSFRHYGLSMKDQVFIKHRAECVVEAKKANFAELLQANKPSEAVQKEIIEAGKELGDPVYN